MTFEEQVAEALGHTLEILDQEHGEAHAPYVLAPRDLARQLAPRVAAAIAAAGRVAIRSSDDAERAREAGIAALRGKNA